MVLHLRLPARLHKELVVPRWNGILRQVESPRAGRTHLELREILTILRDVHHEHRQCSVRVSRIRGDCPLQFRSVRRRADAYAIVYSCFQVRSFFVIVPGDGLERAELIYLAAQRADVGVESIDPQLAAMLIEAAACSP